MVYDLTIAEANVERKCNVTLAFICFLEIYLQLPDHDILRMMKQVEEANQKIWEYKNSEDLVENNVMVMVERSRKFQMLVNERNFLQERVVHAGRNNNPIYIAREAAYSGDMAALG